MLSNSAIKAVEHEQKANQNIEDSNYIEVLCADVNDCSFRGIYKDHHELARKNQYDGGNDYTE